MNVARDIIMAPSGSDKRVKREREVNTLAVSRVFPLPLFRANMEKTANVRIGAATGVM